MSASPHDEETQARIEEAQRSAFSQKALDRLPCRTIAESLAARSADGERPFLITHDAQGRRELSYAAFLARVESRAQALARCADVGRGDRVAVLMHNADEVPITMFAIWRLGATAVPINLGEDTDRIVFVLDDSGAKVAVHLPELASRIAPLKERVPRIVHWLPASPEADAPTVPLPHPEPGDEALIVYTSGTTGPPKGVVLTQRNLLVDCDGIARWHAIDRETRLMCVLPTHHVNGLVVTLLTPFWVGASVVLERRFQTGSFWTRIAEEKVQIASVVPTLLAFLLEDPGGAEGRDLSHFRHLICGAGPLTVELGRRFEEQFGQRIMHGYGLSETTCYSCFLPLDLPPEAHDHWMRDYGFPSIGVAIDANEMAIHDADGKALAAGERGEIVIRGANVMSGYYGRPEANAEAFAHGWFRSGDEGFFQRDETGRAFLFISGRMKELIIRGGVNLSPLEIDEVLNRIPGVARGLAVGFENRWYGEEVGAYVQLEPNASLTEQQILAACRETLPFAKSPKVVIFGDEVPVTATGKYQRMGLRELFRAHADTQFRP